MKPSSTAKRRKTFLLLLAGICFFVAGLAVLAFGAVQHVHPTLTFAGLLRLNPLINLVYSIDL